MVIYEPITPGQVSFLLGFVPLFVAWLYSKLLEYKKNSAPSKVSSDVNLVELGNETVKEDDRSALLEGGGLQSASPRAHNSSSMSHFVKFFLMEESFLLENRMTLRAISEFGVLLIYYYLCDRTNLFGESKKVLFLMYHYFAASEIYNAIQIFIAACVDDWIWELFILLHPQRFQPCKVCSELHSCSGRMKRNATVAHSESMLIRLHSVL